MSMALQSKILQHALPLIPTHSFTRPCLTYALSSLPSDHPDHRAPLEDPVVDTIFGPGSTASRALVEAWEEAGLHDMVAGTVAPAPATVVSKKGKEKALEGLLERRLEYSSNVGEHLVEAYALLASPDSVPSLPIPLETLSNILRTVRFPPSYRPPHSSRPPTTTNTTTGTSSPSTSNLLSSLSDLTGSRLPLLRVNPLGPFSHAWKIASRALDTVAGQEIRTSAVGEPLGGAGVGWYISRAALGMVYLSAESQLLQAYPAVPSDAAEPTPNPHLDPALENLHRGMRRYAELGGLIDGSETAFSDLVGYAELFGRSWAGIIRSRGL